MPQFTDDARGCPACGAPLPRRATGRPATWCGPPCRQAAHRARRRAQRAVADAAWHRERIGAQAAALAETSRALLDAQIGRAHV